MTDKVQKIRKEVVKLKSNLIYGACSSQIAMETRCKEESYNEVLAILDTMQEELVSEDLEEAAQLYAKKEYNRKNPSSLPDRCIGCYAPIMYAFKAGAKWQKEQMMKEALEADVVSGAVVVRKELMTEATKHLSVGTKVKLIIIKEYVQSRR